MKENIEIISIMNNNDSNNKIIIIIMKENEISMASIIISIKKMIM